MDARVSRASEIPPLFTRVPSGLFGPLTGAFAPLYWTILSLYYHYEFEREPFFLLKSVVLDTAEELIRESPVWAERRQELIPRPRRAWRPRRPTTRRRCCAGRRAGR
jgi:hypothetical protein